MTDPAAAPERTPLEERLINLIKLKGPITLGDYMADALGHPHDGYYMTREAIGGDGDFITAPEISQVFGELIGLWLVDAWRMMGSPKVFNLIELGPGRGVLMADILRAAQLRPEFIRAATLWLLETSGRLRHEQQKRLKSYELKPLWADEFADIPPAPSLIVANEFFDCQPIRQFVRTKKGWRERLIGLNSDADRLEFIIGTTPPPAQLQLPEIANEGDVYEISFGAREFVSEISATLKEHSGYALIIDYGHMEAGFGDTLQAVRDHKYWPPLAAPGTADVTAHVDFAALSRAAFDAGIVAHGPVTQGAFLDRLGLAVRVEMLCKGKPPDIQQKIRSGASRIAAAHQMGEVFKVLCLGASGLPSPAGMDE